MGQKPAFQKAQEACFDVINKVFGQDAQWLSAGMETITGIVLFNDPTQKMQLKMVAGRGLSHVGYDNAEIVCPYIEYREGQYPGLWEKVYAGGTLEYISVNGEIYVCKNENSVWDGQTFRIMLEKSESGSFLFFSLGITTVEV